MDVCMTCCCGHDCFFVSSNFRSRDSRLRMHSRKHVAKTGGCCSCNLIHECTVPYLYPTRRAFYAISSAVMTKISSVSMAGISAHSSHFHAGRHLWVLIWQRMHPVGGRSLQSRSIHRQNREESPLITPSRDYTQLCIVDTARHQSAFLPIIAPKVDFPPKVHFGAFRAVPAFPYTERLPEMQGDHSYFSENCGWNELTFCMKLVASVPKSLHSVRDCRRCSRSSSR